MHAGVEHPLQPAPEGSPGSPIPLASDDVRVTFNAPGFYPFFCTEHTLSGMTGVVWVETVP
jgi:plastocyanin